MSNIMLLMSYLLLQMYIVVGDDVIVIHAHNELWVLRLTFAANFLLFPLSIIHVVVVLSFRLYVIAVLLAMQLWLLFLFLCDLVRFYLPCGTAAPTFFVYLNSGFVTKLISGWFFSLFEKLMYWSSFVGYVEAWKLCCPCVQILDESSTTLHVVNTQTGQQVLCMLPSFGNSHLTSTLVPFGLCFFLVVSILMLWMIDRILHACIHFWVNAFLPKCVALQLGNTRVIGFDAFLF